MISRLRPARQQAEESDVFLDLDKLISEPQTFRWRGQVHKVKPISTHVFFQVSAKLSEINRMCSSDVEKLDEARFVRTYSELFAIVCDTIKARDVQDMTNAQRGALLQFVLDCLSGRAQAESEKKKTLKSDPELSPSA